ncbi:hypothetical protein BRADI_5g09575v3 [Brachypodium distachyon]|uniref:Uncharacterized protein n=1 Tax=Brachypodium distachyon TaxID=15368 RepID=A0A0Q3I8V9_BRADI|nr:hypothetical protein BRADI_5g09575v3 [Brachypodium distachyon]
MISHSHSQPHLGHHIDEHNDGDLYGDGAQGSSSDGSLQSSALRTRSCVDMTTRDDVFETFLKRRQTAPGYVSFEDVIGSKEFREGMSGRRPEAGIRDPLVRTASRLYSRPRHRRPSPGPLGTRRGGSMHRFIKLFLSPSFHFIAKVFPCVPGMAAAA